VAQVAQNASAVDVGAAVAGVDVNGVAGVEGDANCSAPVDQMIYWWMGQ
jgi:hypothetical protein